jgi:hypothetical protein
MIPWYLLFRHRITVLDLTPDTDTDSVDATIEAADFYCELNISFESNSEDKFDSRDESDSEDESDSFESVISTIMMLFRHRPKKRRRGNTFFKPLIASHPRILKLSDVDIQLRFSSIARLMMRYWYFPKSVRNTTFAKMLFRG